MEDIFDEIGIDSAKIKAIGRFMETVRLEEITNPVTDSGEDLYNYMGVMLSEAGERINRAIREIETAFNSKTMRIKQLEMVLYKEAFLDKIRQSKGQAA